MNKRVPDMFGKMHPASDCHGVAVISSSTPYPNPIVTQVCSKCSKPQDVLVCQHCGANDITQSEKGDWVVYTCEHCKSQNPLSSQQLAEEVQRLAKRGRKG